jgi:hypothetical protein
MEQALLSARSLVQSSPMRRFILVLCLASWTGWLRSEELNFDFSKNPTGGMPTNWQSQLFGGGQPGVWKVAYDEAPSEFPALTEKALAVSKRAVVAQVSTDSTDERYPLLVYSPEAYGDFTLTTRFKTVSGAAEQMAGLAFRLQDSNNFYVVRASSLGGTLKFYKVVNGERGEPVGVNTPVTSGQWHELSVECKGNYIRCSLDGKVSLPELTDYSFTSGKIGFWTKSDSVTYFTDTKLRFTPREPLATSIVRDTMSKYPRIIELTLFAKQTNGFIRALASNKPERIGGGGGVPERSVIEKNTIFTGMDSRTVTVTLPLHDRNGETVASVRLVMKSFKGQTEQNAIARAMPIVKQMEFRVRNRQDLGD